MACLFHGDYGSADPAFKLDFAATADGRGWSVDASLLKDASNIGEAEAIERHLVRGESVSWCDQGYAWAEQDAIGWFFAAAFLFVVLPYLRRHRHSFHARSLRWRDHIGGPEH